MSRPIITFDHVSKRYRRDSLGSKSLREELARAAGRLLPGLRQRAADATDASLDALRDVSFEVEQGETVGFIGPNGSGKSTVLKLLARITYATQGRITVLGSVSSLIEVGAGFHPELTGRENIYLYGSIMGMRRAEVRRKFDRIVDFAELDRFIDTPVKYYSSGMYVRLGFAVAAHINPHVLLLDEVLAVGDAAFQSKCLNRIEELRRGGTTIVFVSHDMSAVERLCTRVFFLDQGQIRSSGPPQEVIGDYYSTVVFEKTASPPPGNGPTTAATAGYSSGRAAIVDVRFLDRDGKEIDTVATGDPLVARIEYRAHPPVEDPVFELLFHAADGRLYCQLTAGLDDSRVPLLQDRGAVEILCDELGLTPGVYVIDAILGRRGSMDAYDRRPRHSVLRVLPGKPARGIFYLPHRWRVPPTTRSELEVG